MVLFNDSKYKVLFNDSRYMVLFNDSRYNVYIYRYLIRLEFDIGYI